VTRYFSPSKETAKVDPQSAIIYRDERLGTDHTKVVSRVVMV
jgi:hypothetical protein